MATCSICGKSAGLFKKVHTACLRNSRDSRSTMIATAAQSIKSESYLSENLTDKLGAIATQNNLPPQEVRRAIIGGWARVLDQALDDEFLSAEESSNLSSALEFFHISQTDFGARNQYIRFSQANILRELMSGEEVTTNITITANLPFKLQKQEQLLWVFNSVTYYKEKVLREFKGRSAGVGVRVAKGVYLRTGAFNGKAVETVVDQPTGTGLFGITTNHVYFSGGRSSFRIPHSKIVSVEPYDDGVKLMRDASSAKPETFVNLDGWFTYNALMNLS